MSLVSTLSSATEALMAQEEALSVTNDNISNANTAGYAREIVNFDEEAPTEENGVSLGNGVTVESVTSVQDELLNMRIQQQTSDQSSATAQVNALDTLQTLFPSSGTSLSSALSSFFTGLTALSSNPDSSADRETVISDAQTLVNQFNSISAGLSGPTSSLNTTVQTDVTSINQLTAQAASLNSQIVAQNATGQTSGTLTDQLNQIENQLSELTNISVTHTSEGDSITTGSGTPLVLGGQSFNLSTDTDSSGNTQVLDSGGANITSDISSGDLGGTLQVRDTDIPSLLSSIDTLANQFATAFNAAQAKGYDATGAAGTALFTVSSTVAGSAASISLTTTDPNAIAASSDGTSGSNGNVTNLTSLESTALTTGSGSATDQAANITYQVGELASTASANSTAIATSLTSLTDEQSSVSGVSIDEESANLIRYQQAYEAAAKVVTTIESLFDTTIGMISGT
jgi:flagellar hook-associated protein 1 FlgK